MANDINKEDPHYKGEYGSIYEVNRKFPTGGVAGDFVVIDGWAHYWNADRGTWCVNAERDSYWDELITNIIEKFKLVRGATYMGVASLDTVPTKVIGAKMYYFATVAGTYKNFGGLVVPQGINVLYSENGSSWVNTTLLEVAQELGVSTNKVVSQKAVNAALDKKFDKENVSQEFGDSKEKVVSQFALPFRYIQNEEFIFAKVDAEDKLLFGIQLDGTPKFGKTSEVEDELQEQVTLLAERVATIMGDEDTTNVIDTMNELKTFFANIENTQSLTDILANLDNVAKNLDKTVIKDEEGNVQDTPFSVIENEEFLKAIVDAEDRVLFGFYRATGEPYYPLNEMYHIIQNKEYFAAWLDADDKVVLGIRRDGEIMGEIHAVNALKKVISQLQSDLASLQEKVGTIDTNLKELLDIFSLQENPEYLAVEKDAEDRVLSATYNDGTHYSHNLKSETIDAKVDKEQGKSLIDSDVAEANSTLEDPEGRTEIVTDTEDKVLAYRDSDGIRHENGMEVEQFYQKGNKIEYATKSYVDAKPIDDSEIVLSKLDGVVDYSLENLFNKNKIRTYDSDFATKVFNAIGRKTGDTGCYSNNIPCKEGDWFTRNDFGTGIVVVLDKNDNILGDVKNVAYKPTFQIKASEGQDFSKAVSVVMVVMLNALDTERIVNAKYVPTKEEDAIRIPKLKIGQENIELGITTYVKGSSGRYYSIGVDDSTDVPKISLTKLEGIPASELPSDFPKFSVKGDFSKYYDSIFMCPISGGASYMFELGSNGLVKRFRKSLTNCPKTIMENDTRYYYGIDGGMNVSSGKLFIYKGNGETFNVVKGNVTDTEGNLLEPHDCCVISVNPLHVITQRYVENQTTIVDGVAKTVTSLVLEEQYDGNRVWQWNSTDYPELWKDSHYKGNNADYLHNNTISLDNDGNLLLNNKQANQMLVIERSWNDSSHTGSIGNILWKIGGNRGDGYDYDVATRIKTTEEQQWYESHDAIVREDGVYTMFDNRKSYPSRIIEFKVDKAEKNLTDFKAYTYKKYGGRYMGSVDKCAEGIFLVSWGSFRSTESSNIGIYDFKNNKAIFELNFENKAYNAYRVYGIKL